MDRFSGLFGIADHLIKIGCCLKCVGSGIKTAPCFSPRDSCGKHGGKEYAELHISASACRPNSSGSGGRFNIEDFYVY